MSVNELMLVLYGICQALVRSMSSATTSHILNQQSFKTSSMSLIDTFRRISLPGDIGGVSSAVADDSCPLLSAPLDLNTVHSSQSAVTYRDATVGYVVPSPRYLSPTSSIETAALHELQAFADIGGIDYVSTRSPDTTDSACSRDDSENSSIGQSTSFVVTDDNSHGLKSPLSDSLSPSICTMCGRGCGCQKHSKDTVYRRISEKATNTCHSGSNKMQSRSHMFDTYDYNCTPQSSSPSAFLSSLSTSSVQQQQSHHSDIITGALFSSPLEMSITLRELSIAAREPFTGNIADLIEHTIQAVVDAHVDTCPYTCDKVAAGLHEYEHMLSTKPIVSLSSSL